MQKILYKISAILLCGLLIYNSLGYFVVFSVMRIAIRQQKWALLSTLPEQDLSTFVFDKTASNARLEVINKHEIKVDGRLYDIVRQSENGNTITYSCLQDHKEESLIAQTRLINSRAQQMPLQNTARLIIEKIITTAVLGDETKISADTVITYFSTSIENYYVRPTLQIALPPPQSCC